ncbi:MAG TPA: hypothetical protein DEA94_06850 [Rhodobacteraceae bacterium]|nr:hypothetical protein [Paracoccaceae bacterium]
MPNHLCCNAAEGTEGTTCNGDQNDIFTRRRDKNRLVHPDHHNRKAHSHCSGQIIGDWRDAVIQDTCQPELQSQPEILAGSFITQPVKQIHFFHCVDYSHCND